MCAVITVARFLVATDQSAIDIVVCPLYISQTRATAIRHSGVVLRAAALCCGTDCCAQVLKNLVSYSRSADANLDPKTGYPVVFLSPSGEILGL